MNEKKVKDEVAWSSDEMTRDEVRKLVKPIFPDAFVTLNIYGHWIITTNIREKK